MTDEELRDIHALFEREAFYHSNGRPKLTPPVELSDLHWILIKTHHNWAHEWWKEYIGIVVLAKLIFHKTPEGWQFLYEAIPIKLAGHHIYVAKSIPANCLHVMEPFNYATGLRGRGIPPLPTDEDPPGSQTATHALLSRPQHR